MNKSMLEKEVLSKENSIEEIFCKEFEKLPIQEMDSELASILLQLLLGEIKEIPEKDKPFIMKLIEKRIEVCFDYEILDPKLLLFLSIVSETPGKAVMYLTYLQYWANKNNIKKIDINIFCEKIFPNGFPSDKDLKGLWDSQKIHPKDHMGSDNLIDYKVPLESIRFDSDK